ncbi:ABC-F family ATP-binding cassette domain-containing protein [Legionella sp. CNM-4043-24]|uniref:ABC-F family ATP-binding cassette domain-containing protein n=1 Tax=Legionella sp. CNM-4043-24 TaxID=3421646 RepID=UPI00403A8633
MIALNQLNMAYGQKLLFYDVNLNLNPGNCYALVGANGCGKSTFFRLITGEEELTSGDIIIPKEATIGWLKQDQFRYEDTPIRDIVLEGKPILWAAMQERESLLTGDDWDDEKGFRFAELEEVINHYDGYTAVATAESILTGLGIAASYFEKPLKSLSGGYKLRVLLAQTLFQNPSILLLDEPTNHLDILSIRWLEKFLKNEFQGLVIFISHDLDFIDNLSDYILDLDYGEIRQYKGNYNQFLAEKKLIEEQRLTEKKSAEAKIADMQKFVDKFGAKASKAAQARSRMKMIEKIEIPDIKNSSRVAPAFHFVPKRVSGKQVVKAEGISKSFKTRTLFQGLNFEVNRGEKVAIMGVNGIGKSTLTKIIAGVLAADAGTITHGHEVRISYFSQDHHEFLNSSCTVMDWLHDAVADVNEQQVRKILGQMLFVKDDVHKDILSLSGGEAARLLLARVMLESPNVIILDEPTNHMDLETIQSLAKALSQFTGTVLFVSHNRYFINKIATRVLYFAPDQDIIDYKGKYSEFAIDGMD